MLKCRPAPEVERRLAQLVAVTDIYAWKVLRRDLGLDRDAVEASVRDLAHRILDHEAASTDQPAPEHGVN
jgi:hypothetical protein